MDNWLSTQRKDYVWPFVTTFGVKEATAAQFRGTENKYNSCFCNNVQPLQRFGDGHREQFKENQDTADQQWSRLGPMGTLLDAKLFPARVSAAPEVDAGQCDQRNLFLKQLQRKYPYLYGVLQKESPDALIARVNKDRLRSTYQVDFCQQQLGLKPADEYERLLSGAQIEGVAPCPPPIRLPTDRCPPNIRSVAYRPSTDVTKPPHVSRDKGPEKKETKNPYISEYQDHISKLGAVIIRDKLHYHETTSKRPRC